MTKVPNPNICYLGPSEIKLLGLEEEYVVAAARRAAEKTARRGRDELEKETPRESKRIA